MLPAQKISIDGARSGGQSGGGEVSCGKNSDTPLWDAKNPGINALAQWVNRMMG
jgi:hypothetical protein